MSVARRPLPGLSHRCTVILLCQRGPRGDRAPVDGICPVFRGRVWSARGGGCLRWPPGGMCCLTTTSAMNKFSPITNLYTMISLQSVGFSHRPRCNYIIRAPIIVSLVCSHCKLCTVKLRLFLLTCIKLIVLSFLYEYDNFVFLAQSLWTLRRWLEIMNIFCQYVLFICYYVALKIKKSWILNPATNRYLRLLHRKTCGIDNLDYMRLSSYIDHTDLSLWRPTKISRTIQPQYRRYGSRRLRLKVLYGHGWFSPCIYSLPWDKLQRSIMLKGSAVNCIWWQIFHLRTIYSSNL